MCFFFFLFKQLVTKLRSELPTSADTFHKHNILCLVWDPEPETPNTVIDFFYRSLYVFGELRPGRYFSSFSLI